MKDNIMESNKEHLDNILKSLRDYQPEARPDWEAFYDANRQAFDAESGADRRSPHSGGNRNLKYLGIILAILISMLLIYPFVFQHKSKKSEQQQEIVKKPLRTENAAEPVIAPAREPASVVPGSITPSAKAKSIPTKPKVETTAPAPIQPRSIPETTIAKPTAAAIDSLQTENMSQPPDLQNKTKDTVILHKTVIIRDTVRIKKPIRK